jgi:hypothetical protein
MRRDRWLGLGIMLCVGATAGLAASADGDADADRLLDQPGALVGTYDGRWRWTDCAVPGEARGAVELDYVDGRWRVDLTAIHPGAGAGAATDDGTALARVDGGVTIAVTPSGPGTITAALRLPSGCRGDAALSRAAPAVSACAGLAGQLRVHGACSTATALVGDPASLLTADAAKASDAGARCQRAEATLRRALIDDGCVPVPLAERPIEVPSCRALLALGGQARACAAMPPGAREALASAAFAVGAARVPPGSSAAVVDVAARQCDATAARVRAALVQARC